MIKQSIKYTNFDGKDAVLDAWFNLTEAELMEMELSETGGLAEKIQQIVDAKDQPSIIKVFQEIILKAYGERSEDGVYFYKEDENGRPLSQKFKQTAAYSALFMELALDADKAAKFVNGICPQEKVKNVAKIKAAAKK